MKSRWRTIVKWCFLYPAVFVLCMELALRILGWGTFYVDDYSIRTEPENAFIGHSELGIQLNPGQYRIILNDSVRFTATHGEGNYRVIPAGKNELNPAVLMLGCSFTYGYGVNDDENFVSLLQKEFPDFNFRNAGVIGYGTVQSLMQLREAIKKDSLQAVVLNFSSFHLMRNGLSQTYRSNLKMGYQRSSQTVESLMREARFPYINSCDLKINYQPWETMYTNWYGREWSAIVNWQQLADDRRKDARIDELMVAMCIIHEIVNLCEDRGIAFGLVCLDTTPETEELNRALPEIDWLNAGFDFTNEALTNLPYDSHPSAEGHAYLAEKMKPFLTGLMDGK
ncbi:MAG: hypothetical protein HEP71_12895 [Roseivirga sp.]|nr:hypothetical protein [Roseivirga sp.]